VSGPALAAMCFEEPERFVEQAGNAGQQVGGIFISSFIGMPDAAAKGTGDLSITIDQQVEVGIVALGMFRQFLQA